MGVKTCRHKGQPPVGSSLSGSHDTAAAQFCLTAQQNFIFWLSSFLVFEKIIYGRLSFRQRHFFFVNNFTGRISHLSRPAVGSVRLRSRPGPARPRCYCGPGARDHSTVLLRSQSCRAKLDPSTELSLSPARDQVTTLETFRSGKRPFDPFFQVAAFTEAFELLSQ